MALKLVSRVQQNNQTPQEENKPGFGRRVFENTVGALATSIPQFAQSVGRTFADLAPSRRGGMPELTRDLYEGPSLSQDIRAEREKSQGFAPGSLEPQGYGEKVLNSVAQTAPISALTGGASWGKNLFNDALVSSGQVGAEELGLGVPEQIIGGILAPILFKGGKNLLSKTGLVKPGHSIPRLNELAESAKKDFYAKEAQLGSKINVPAKDYVSGLEKIGEKIVDNTALSLSEKQDLVSKINQFTTDANSGKINAAKLVQREKELNALWSQTQGPKNRVFREFVGQTRKFIEDIGDKIGSHHKEWHKNWKDAKDIVKAQNYKTTISEMAEDFPGLGKYLAKPMVKGLLGLSAGGAIGGAGAAVLGAVGTAGFGRGERLWGFMQKPAGQKLVHDSIKNIIDRNGPALKISLTKLNKAVDRYEEENPEPPKKKLKLVSRA